MNLLQFLSLRCGKSLLLVAALLFFCPTLAGSTELVLFDQGGKEIFSAQLPEDTFAIRYIHSVAQTPVTDFFRADPPDIVLDRTQYRDFGAGLPHAPSQGQRMQVIDGNIVISGYNMRMPQFDLRVGRVAGHTLLIPETRGVREVPLASVAQPGQAVTLKVR